MELERLRGVAIIAKNPAGDILILREHLEKPALGKFAGMLSIPMETKKPGESDISALENLFVQEMPGISFPKLAPEYRGAYQLAPDVWATLYTAPIGTFSLPVVSDPHENVDGHRWVSVGMARGLWLRRGAIEMIEDYAANRRNVICPTCRDLPRPKVLATR